MAANVIKLCFYDDSEEDESEEDASESEEDEETEKTNHQRSSLSICRSGEKRKPSPSLDSRLEVKADPPETLSKSPTRSSSPPIIKKPRLPLPSAFLSSSSSPADPRCSSLNGRVRTFAHVRGNWASHVFLKPFDDDDSMEELGEKIVRVATDLLRAEAVAGVKVHALPAEDLHLSLSRTFVLSHHLISSFASSLTTALEKTASTSLGGGTGFLLAFSSKVKVYFNDEKTRGFIAIQAHPSCDKRLRHLTRAVDATLKEFNLSDQVFYSDPSFHLSLAWFLPPGVAPPQDGAKEGQANGDNGFSPPPPPPPPTTTTTTTPNNSSSVPPSQTQTQLSSNPPSPDRHEPLPPDVVTSLERDLSSLVAAHFREEDSPSKTLLAEAAVDATSTAVLVKRAWLRTGNKLLSFPL